MELRNKIYSGQEVASILASIFPDRNFENLSILSVYKQMYPTTSKSKIKGRGAYSFNDLVVTAALVLACECGIAPSYFAEAVKTKTKWNKNKEQVK